MDTFQLKCFISVARTLNFTEAARQNYITQPAISRQISDLEQSLGVKLLYRTRHSVVLTEEGQEFLRYAEEAIENETTIRARLCNISQGNSGYIRIAVLSDMYFVLSKCISEMSARYPAIQYKIDRMPGASLALALPKKEHDFYFATTASFTTTHGFSYVETHQEKYVLAVNKKIASKVDSSDFSTFAKLPFAFISRSAGPIYYDRTLAFCSSIGYKPLLMSYFNCAEAIMLAVNAGIGISIMNESGARANIMEDVALLPICPEQTALIGAIGWRNNGLSNTAQKFHTLIQELFPAPNHRTHNT